MSEIYSIIEKNLEKMVGDNKGDMFPLLCNESMGGNASRWKGLSCAGANFYYDPLNGEMQYFENSQHVPEDILDRCSHGILRVAIRIRHKVAPGEHHTKYRIIRCLTPINIRPAAKANIEETIKEYNKRYGFEIPE